MTNIPTYTILITTLLLIVTTVPAQTTSTSAFFEKYHPQDDAPASAHRYWAEKLAGDLFGEDQVSEWLSDPSKLNVVVLQREAVAAADLQALQGGMGQEGFEPVLKARDRSESFDIWVRTGEGYIRNILYLVTDKDEFVCLQLSGQWTLQDLFDNCRQF